MKTDGSKEPQEELDDAIAEFQVLENAPATERARATRRVLRAAKIVGELLDPTGARHPSPHTPYGEGAHTIPPAPASLEFISVTEFLALDIPKVDWLLDRIIPKGALGCCSGYAKVGKTTFLFHYLRVGARPELRVPPSPGGCGGEGDTQPNDNGTDPGQFLGRAVAPVRAAWIRLEEPLPLFRGRLADLGLGGRDLFVLKPCDGPPPTIHSLGDLRDWIVKTKVELLVIDPMIDFLLVEDENDAAEMSAALRPLRDAAHQTGCTIILLHHDRKAEGRGLQMLRGSTAIAATFDFLLRIDYLHGEYEPERKVEVTGRFSRDRLHCRLGSSGYELVDPEEVATERKESRREEGTRRREEADEQDADRLLDWLRRRGRPATLKEIRMGGLGFGEKRLSSLLLLLGQRGAIRHVPHRGSTAATWEGAPASGGAGSAGAETVAAEDRAKSPSGKGTRPDDDRIIEEEL